MIILVDEPRPARLRRALDEWYEASNQWVEKTIALAIELKEARDEYGSMMTRSSTRWFSPYADREMCGEQRDKIKRVFHLVHAMASAMEENPSGELKRPPSPTTDGEWP